MLITAIHALMPFGDVAGVPEWVHLVPAGTFGGRDGRGPYTLRDAAGVITASMAAGKLPIDENHAIDHALATGMPSPARGWIVELQSRADGIWGRVEWTPEGRALMEGRAYRGISPAFAHTEKGGVVVSVLRAALTNAPNLPQLASLHTQNPKETTVDLTALRSALGLAETADEAAILAAAQAAGKAVATHSQQLVGIAKAAGLGDDAKPEAIVTALQARTAAGDPLKMATDLVALQAQVTTMAAERSRGLAIAAVDGAIKAGKPIPASLRDHYVARHMVDPVAVETELAGLPSLHAGGITAPPPATGAVVDADEARVIALLGVDPKKFAETKAAIGQKMGVA